jgi:hypothetical protein
MKTKPAKARKAGRPPAGIGGQPSSRYPQLAVRVPQETIDQVAELAERLDVAQWQVVREAIALYRCQSRRTAKG